MINVENIETFNFKAALRAMRNPLNSWNKSDSGICGFVNIRCNDCQVKNIDYCTKNDTVYLIGKNDMELCKKLIAGGTEHRKFLRQIFISIDITAPLYWWKEFDTYKVGTVANSCSTMHTLHKRDLTLNDFSYDKLTDDAVGFLEDLLLQINEYRKQYADYEGYLLRCAEDDILPVDKKELWYTIIQLLPSSYNQKRTVTMNYENAINIINQRYTHKLDEWRKFCKTLLELPYIKDFMNGVGYVF